MISTNVTALRRIRLCDNVTAATGTGTVPREKCCYLLNSEYALSLILLLYTPVRADCNMLTDGVATWFSILLISDDTGSLCCILE